MANRDQHCETWGAGAGSHAFWCVVFPNQLVVLGPGAGAVVGAADERGLALWYAGALDDAVLTVYKAELRIRHQANLEQAASLAGGHQQVMQHIQPRLGGNAVHVHQMRKMPGIPGQAQQSLCQFLAAGTGGHAHRLYILGADRGIADNANARNVGRGLTDQLQQAALKVARDAVKAGGAGQARF